MTMPRIRSEVDQQPCEYYHQIDAVNQNTSAAISDRTGNPKLLKEQQTKTETCLEPHSIILSVFSG